MPENCKNLLDNQLLQKRLRQDFSTNMAVFNPTYPLPLVSIKCEDAWTFVLWQSKKTTKRVRRPVEKQMTKFSNHFTKKSKQSTEMEVLHFEKRAFLCYQIHQQCMFFKMQNFHFCGRRRLFCARVRKVCHSFFSQISEFLYCFCTLSQN